MVDGGQLETVDQRPAANMVKGNLKVDNGVGKRLEGQTAVGDKENQIKLPQVRSRRQKRNDD